MPTTHGPQPHGHDDTVDLPAAALRTAGAGCWVFPVRPGGKAPAAPAAHPAGSREGHACRGSCGRWGHGLHDASTDPTVVAAMWRRWPTANIGVACGPSGLLVIDLDTVTGSPPARVLREQQPGEATPFTVTDGAAVLEWLCERCGGRLEDLDTLTVATPSGGRHLYYRAPDLGTGVRVTSGAGMLSGLGWGVDVRGWGGYVIVPPSTRPDGVYQRAGGVLRPAPGWLLEALAAVGRVPGHAPAPIPAVSPSGRRWHRPVLRLLPGGLTDGLSEGAAEERRRRYLAAAVTGELTRVWDAEAGQLNNTLARAAFALGQLVTGAGLDRGTVADALLAAARHAGTRHEMSGGKPFDQVKTLGTIHRALTAGQAHPRTVSR